MNLNKYGADGWPYNSEEAAERAYAIFNVRFIAEGYSTPHGAGLGEIAKRAVKPYNVGRNRTKRLAKERTAYFRSLTK